MERVWKRLGSGSCAGRQPETEKKWASLFRAVSRRDPDGIEYYSGLLRNGDQASTTAEMKYLVAAGMVSSLVTGKKDGCLALWKRYRPALYGNDKPDIVFPFLAAQCVGGITP